MKITKEDIERAIEINACEDGLTWAESLNGAELNTENVDSEYFLWATGKGCVSGEWDQDLFDFCVEKYSWAALEYTKELLSPEQLDFCMREEPKAALIHARGLLSLEQIKTAEALLRGACV